MGVPYLCPVCKGKKKVRKGFYPDKPESTQCETCWGQGIVWDNSNITYYTPLPQQPVEPNYWQGYTIIQCPNCQQWHTLGDGHSCIVSGVAKL